MFCRGTPPNFHTCNGLRVGAQRRRAFGLRPVPSLPSRPFGFNPSRLRACGAARYRLPLGGDSPQGFPRRTLLGVSRYRRTGIAGSARPAPAAMGRALRVRRGLLRQVARKRAVLDADGGLSGPSRRPVHRHAPRPCHDASTPRLKPSAAGCGGHSCLSLWARPCRHQGAYRRRLHAERRAGHRSIRVSSARCVLGSL